MRITKFGHCCLLIEEKNQRILMDPGVYNKHPEVTDIDVLLITHEHADHCHIDSVKKIVASNPNVEVITHSAVVEILKNEGVETTVIHDGDDIERKRVFIGSRGHAHAHIHPEMPTCVNTGFLINKRLFFPGDSFHKPEDTIEILALPVSGPWMKLEEAIDYAKAVAPKVFFPVHDGMLKDEAMESSRMHPKAILEPLGIKLRDMRAGSVEEY